LKTNDNKTSAVRISRILQSEVTDCTTGTCGKARKMKQLFRKEDVAENSTTMFKD
jgi:hypothetical protein